MMQNKENLKSEARGGLRETAFTEKDRDRISLTGEESLASAFNAMLCLSSICQRFPSLPCSLSPVPHSFLFSALTSPLLLLLLYFLLQSITARSFIYGHALSACVGLSKTHLSCATIIQSLIPSHFQGMKHEHRYDARV